MDEIGVRRRFVPMPVISHLKPEQYGKAYQLANVGSPWTAWRNLFAGVSDPASAFVYGYSLLDLLSAPMLRGDMLEKSSVYAFLSARPYATETAIESHSRNLAEAFACPTYLSSARSYRSWLAYGFRLPEPSTWLLDGNTAEALFAPWRSHLETRAGNGSWGRLDLQMLAGVRELGLSTETGRIDRLGVGAMPRRRTPRRGDRVHPSYTYDVVVNGDVILAIPPGPLAELISLDVVRRAPALADVHRLRSEPMISLELYFNRRLPGIPQGVALLLGSQFDLSFLDNAQIWRDWDGGTFLDVIASDAKILVNYRDEQIIELMIAELKRFVRFEDADLEPHRTHLKTNVGEELFINQVGSWHYRPTATTAIPNLFIAGDFCRTPIDVVTVEGAVASGLQAAEAVRRRHGLGAPITMQWPDTYPAPLVEAMVVAGAPLVGAAAAMSMAGGALGKAYRALFPNG